MVRPLHALRDHLGASIVGAVIVAGLAGGGLGYALTSPSGSPTPTAATGPGPGANGPASGTHPSDATHLGVRGTITAVTGSSWTLRTAKGVTVTVTVGPGTTYGTKRSPAKASDFTVGTEAAVMGTRQGDNIIAVRVISPVHRGS